jgi:MFS transporter, PHS family, inorganic phosphate transporter
LPEIIRDFFGKAQIMTANWSTIFKLGAGFFADAYDLFVIDTVMQMLKLDAKNGNVDELKGWVGTSTSIGSVVGMILFGIIGDSFGRFSAIVTTGSIVAVMSLACAFCGTMGSFSIVHQLILLRFILGVGIGGEYPLSAAMANESTAKVGSARITAGVFAMQGFGKFFSPLLAIILLKIFTNPGAQTSSPNDLRAANLIWRFLLGFGCVPALIAVAMRLKMTETSAYLKTERNSVGKSRLARIRDIWVIVKQHWKPLLGTASTWFLLDVTFYGTGMFTNSIAASIFDGNSGENELQKLHSSTLASLILTTMAIPGYLCAYIFIDSMGRYRMQVWGFIAVIICYMVVGNLSLFEQNSYLILCGFGLTFFFTNFGPNTTTFIIPSEIFPAAVRTTCHGISAAFGKVGAVVGGFGLAAMKSGASEKSKELANILFVCAGVATLGLICTLAFVPKDVVYANEDEPSKDEKSPAPDTHAVV